MPFYDNRYPISKDDTIEHLQKVLEGRRVLKVARRIYPPDEENNWDQNAKADYPYLLLDDGSEIILLDGWGFPPISEVEKAPWVDLPQMWDGDNA